MEDKCCSDGYTACGDVGTPGDCCDSDATCCAGSDGTSFVGPFSFLIYYRCSYYHVLLRPLDSVAVAIRHVVVRRAKM